MRADKERHLIAIRDAFWTLAARNQRPPTNREIAVETGLSEQTISKRISEANLHRSIEADPNLKALSLLTGDVMLGIFFSARDGNAASAKLWLKLMGWKEPKATCSRCKDRGNQPEGVGDALVRMSRAGKLHRPSKP